MSPEDRELPISLRGIEAILKVFNSTLKEPSSIRQISVETDLSMRVTKNILTELENLKQVKQVVEEGQKTSKWTLTDLGKQIAKAIESPIENGNISHTEKLLENLIIPKKIEEINSRISTSHKANLNLLNQIQMELSKTMGLCFSYDDPAIAEKLSGIIRKIKDNLKTLDTFRGNPLVYFNLKKVNSNIQLNNKQKRTLLCEIALLNQILHNQINQISLKVANMTDYIEKEEMVGSGHFSAFFNKYYKMVDQINILKHLLLQRSTLETNYHVLNEDNLRRVQKNQITEGIIKKYLPEVIPDSNRKQIIQDQLVSFISNITSDKDQSSDFMPLIAFYGLFKDYSKYTGIGLDDFEESLSTLGDQDLIVGIKTIKNGGDEKYKVIQFTTDDLMAEEIRLLRYALEVKSFSITDIMNELEWEKQKTQKILEILTANGLLRHSDSYLNGEKWYLVS